MIGIIILAAILLIYWSFTSAPQQETPPTGDWIDLEPAEAKALIDSNPDLVIIDVSPNYLDGHLPGAINYYIGDGSLDAAISSGELDPEATYLVYCHFESASVAGARRLASAGYTTYRLKGDYPAWLAAGYPIEQ